MNTYDACLEVLDTAKMSGYQWDILRDPLHRTTSGIVKATFMTHLTRPSFLRSLFSDDLKEGSLFEQTMILPEWKFEYLRTLEYMTEGQIDGKNWSDYLLERVRAKRISNGA